MRVVSTAAVAAALLLGGVRVEAQTAAAPAAPPKPAGEVPPPPVAVPVPVAAPAADGPPQAVPAPPAPPAPPRPVNLVTPNGLVEFARCDGFGAPNKNGDGMTVMAGQLANLFVAYGAYGNTTRSDVRVGADGARMCDAALAAPALEPRYELRRASLLRARAIHRLAAGDRAGAAADVAASRAAVGPASGGALYERSMAVGADYVEAYALAMDGRKAEAAALARAAFAKRPYSRQSAVAAWLVLEKAGDRSELEAHLRALSRLNPEAIEGLYDALVEDGRWADALAVYPQMKAPRLRQEARPYGYGPAGPLDVREKVAAEAWGLRRGAGQAYALAASGAPAEARAALAAARERLARVSEPPAAPTIRPGRRKVLKRDQERYEFETRANATLRDRGGDILERWAPLIEARALLAEGDTAGALAAVQALDPRRIPDPAIWSDLRAAVRERLPEAEKARLVPMRAVEGEARPAAALTTLLQALPEAERIENLPRFEARTSSWGGWSIDTRDDGVTEIRYHSVDATAPSAVEEMALLRAADLALKAGKPGVLVIGRKDTQHTTYVVTYGVPGPPIPTGYSSDLEVLLVDPAALPPGYAGAEWRVLDAAKIYADLEPHYPSKAEVRAARDAAAKKKD